MDTDFEWTAESNPNAPTSLIFQRANTHPSGHVLRNSRQPCVRLHSLASLTPPTNNSIYLCLQDKSSLINTGHLNIKGLRIAYWVQWSNRSTSILQTWRRSGSWEIVWAAKESQLQHQSCSEIPPLANTPNWEQEQQMLERGPKKGRSSNPRVGIFFLLFCLVVYYN